MATRAFRPQRDDTMLTGWQSMPESAPSVERKAEPTAARILVMIGLVLLAAGLLAVAAPALKYRYFFGPVVGVFFTALGLALVVYHAFTDGESEFRLVYTGVSALLVFLALLLRLIPIEGKVGAWFLPVGVPALVLALVFILAVLRQETDSTRHDFVNTIVGVLGAGMVLVGLFGGHLRPSFLLDQGVALVLLGVMYLAVFMTQHAVDSVVAYRAGLGLGAVGVFSLLLTVAKIYWSSAPEYFVPTGLTLLLVSAFLIALSLCACSEWQVIVLFRRELGSFFHSPIAYLVLLGVMLVSWVGFALVMESMEGMSRGREGGYPYPVFIFILTIFNIALPIFVVPILTMRLLAEEQRSGTMEVLLTAPVNEGPVVLSKFFAALTYYLLTWVPAFLFLIALRTWGGREFDFRPLLSFILALTCTGAGFVAAGLFFSSLSRNQIVAAVLTFAYMIAQYIPNWRGVLNLSPDSVWNDIMIYISFLDLWITSLLGTLAPRLLVYHVTVAVFFLYLTTKVLEARKWK